ncbi:MAG: hypothetical protein PHT19_16675 [Methylococcus sp.]|nr:hypothetical protein [Methylococcus sp.]
MSKRTQVMTYGSAAAATLAASGSAMAGVGADAATALQSTLTEASTAGGAVVLLVAGLAVFAIVNALIKKA